MLPKLFRITPTETVDGTMRQVDAALNEILERHAVHCYRLLAPADADAWIEELRAGLAANRRKLLHELTMMAADRPEGPLQ